MIFYWLDVFGGLTVDNKNKYVSSFSPRNIYLWRVESFPKILRYLDKSEHLDEIEVDKIVYDTVKDWCSGLDYGLSIADYLTRLGIKNEKLDSKNKS